MTKIKNITILGSGNLGSRIGLQAAISGYEVIFYDLNDAAFIRAADVFQKVLKHLTKHNLVKSEDHDSILSRISFTSDAAEAVQDADLISESVTEELTIKQKVWEQFGKVSPDKTIFTTNTSYLLPSQLAEISGRPEKFCAFHFHDVFTARVVDIMPHAGTDPTLIPLLEDLGRKLNQVPVIIKQESPGYVFNFMLMALIGAAGQLKTKNIADIEAIDKSWMVNFNTPLGPFGILDNIGLDTAWHVVHGRADKASVAFSALLKTYIDQGKLGEKTGEGFYKYPNPEYRQSHFMK
ncbi:MAG: 3-hydroxyacyl-CoA dehydrogenase [Bacteroidetes bacterium]|nr:3-hydroxyacyl-CoA dehydrogenase [Bacteroidota bacterium]